MERETPMNTYRRNAVAGILIFFSAASYGFSPSCLLGAKCIKTQGTSIPSVVVIEMMERCDEFTQNGIGRTVLKLTLQQINQRSGNDSNHPLFSAYYAFTRLHESPLIFDRKSRVEETSYDQIANSCRVLNQDFDKWAQ